MEGRARAGSLHDLNDHENSISVALRDARAQQASTYFLVVQLGFGYQR